VSELQSDLVIGEGWKHASLGKLLPLKYGKSLPAQLRNSNGTHPVYGSSGVVGMHSAAFTNGPTLIVGRKGNVGAIHYSAVPCWPIDTAYFVEAPAGHNLRYYKYLLESLNLVKLDRSTAIPGLSRDDYNAVKVSVAPPGQQDEIVAEIEKQFSRLDEAVANLQRVKANLKRYKASVLKDAVEGRLAPLEAELARSECRSFETGEQLLQRILEARRNQWIGRGKYREPAEPGDAGYFPLPEGWTWGTFDQLHLQIADVDHKMPKAVDAGVPYVSTKDFFGDEGINFAGAKRISTEDFEALCRKVRPENGDILLSRYGTIGEVRLVTTDDPFQASYSVAIMKPVRDHIPASFLATVLRSDVVISQIKRDVRATAQPDLGLAHIRQFIVPIPPIAEQQRIVAETDRCLSIVRGVEAEVDANLKRAQALRQSVLSKSFIGR